MAIYNMGVIYPGLALIGLEIFTNFLFLGHSFGSRYAGKSIEGSKDTDDNLHSKKNKPKYGSLDWRPGPGNLS